MLKMFKKDYISCCRGFFEEIKAKQLVLRKCIKFRPKLTKTLKKSNFEKVIQFLYNFGKPWRLRFSKTFNKDHIGCQKGFFKKINEVLLGKQNAQFATKNDNNFKMYQFFTFSCNFCQIFKDFMDQNLKYLQPRMISLSNRVVCGDKCSFVRKKNCNKDPKIVEISYFFYIFVFYNASLVKVSTFP